MKTDEKATEQGRDIGEISRVDVMKLHIIKVAAKWVESNICTWSRERMPEQNHLGCLHSRLCITVYCY